MTERKDWLTILIGQAARYRLGLAVTLISILPFLSLVYILVVEPFKGQQVDRQAVTAILASVTLCVFSGYLLLLKYPFTLRRIRETLREVSAGVVPDRITLLNDGQDITSIEQALNTVLNELRERVIMVEKEKALMDRELQQSQKLRSMGVIAAGIAHEINSPVQFVTDNMHFLLKATTQLLHHIETLEQMGKQRTAPPAGSAGSQPPSVPRPDLAFLEKEMQEAIAQSLRGLELVASIVKSMYDFSHMGIETQKTLVNINELIQSAATMCRNQWKHVANVEFKLDQAIPLVSCFPGDISQILLNLISNAAGAIRAKGAGSTAPKGTITLSTRIDEDYVQVTVTDTGAGIPESVRNDLFGNFVTTKKRGEGTGQGLAITHKLVQKHNGTISFETETGKGTVFLLRLPVRDSK